MEAGSCFGTDLGPHRDIRTNVCVCVCVAQYHPSLTRLLSAVMRVLMGELFSAADLWETC